MAIAEELVVKFIPKYNNKIITQILPISNIYIKLKIIASYDKLHSHL